MKYINAPTVIHESWSDYIIADSNGHILNMEQVHDMQSDIIRDLDSTGKCLPSVNKNNIIFKHLSLDLAKYNVFFFNEKPYDYSIGNVDLNTGFAWASKKGSSTNELDVITSELKKSLGEAIYNFDYTLEHWLEQGVMPLNICQTVVEYDNNSNSHLKHWKEYSKCLIEYISSYHANKHSCCIFVFCGKIPQLFNDLVDTSYHKVFNIESPTSENTSLFSKFLDSSIFPEINSTLEYHGKGKDSIDWANNSLGNVYGYGQGHGHGSYPDNWDILRQIDN